MSKRSKKARGGGRKNDFAEKGVAAVKVKSQTTPSFVGQRNFSDDAKTQRSVSSLKNQRPARAPGVQRGASSSAFGALVEESSSSEEEGEDEKEEQKEPEFGRGETCGGGDSSGGIARSDSSRQGGQPRRKKARFDEGLSDGGPGSSGGLRLGGTVSTASTTDDEDNKNGQSDGEADADDADDDDASLIDPLAPTEVTDEALARTAEFLSEVGAEWRRGKKKAEWNRFFLSNNETRFKHLRRAIFVLVEGALSGSLPKEDQASPKSVDQGRQRKGASGVVVLQGSGEKNINSDNSENFDNNSSDDEETAAWREELRIAISTLTALTEDHVEEEEEVGQGVAGKAQSSTREITKKRYKLLRKALFELGVVVSDSGGNEQAGGGKEGGGGNNGGTKSRKRSRAAAAAAANQSNSGSRNSNSTTTNMFTASSASSCDGNGDGNGTNTSRNNSSAQSVSLVSRISLAISLGCYEHAILYLIRMGRKQQRPKLGTLQRWVREADAAGTDDPVALQMLDQMLRVANPEMVVPVPEEDKAGSYLDPGSFNLIRRFKSVTMESIGASSSSSPTSSAPPLQSLTSAASLRIGDDGIRRVPDDLQEAKRKHFRLCEYIPGADRRPANRYDLRVYTNVTPGLIEFADGNDFEPAGEAGEGNSPAAEAVVVTGAGEGNPPASQGLKGTGRNPEEEEEVTKREAKKAEEERLLTKHEAASNRAAASNRETVRVSKVDVPHVPGTFVLKNVLTKEECQQFLEAAESAGYHPDEPLGGQPGASVLANACVWCVDESIERKVFSRVKQFLPDMPVDKRAAVNPTTEASGKDSSSENSSMTTQPLGLNRRWRCYRYVPGKFYRPHIDGAWPKSGMSENEHFVLPKGVQEWPGETIDSGNILNSDGTSTNDGDTRSKTTSDTNGAGDATTPAPISVPITPTPKYLYDCSDGTVLSRLTFLIYWNDDFDGGWTTYFTPSKEEPPRMGKEEGQKEDSEEEEAKGEARREAAVQDSGSAECCGGEQQQEHQMEKQIPLETDKNTKTSKTSGLPMTSGVLNAFRVQPSTGCVAVFPHGDTANALLHEGSPVLRGCKYVVRTEVLYRHDKGIKV